MDWRVVIGLALGGLPLGGLFALQAMGIVLVYRTTRVFTFAQAGIGLMAAFVTADLNAHLPTLLAVLVGLVVAIGINLVIEQAVRRTRGAIQQTVVTLGALLALQGLAGWWFGTTGTAAEPVSGKPAVTWDYVGLLWTHLQVAVLIIVAVVGVGLALFLSRTSTGTAMRAVADDPEAARLLGLSAGRISSLAWGLGGAMAGLSGILASPQVGLDQISLVVITVQALGATLVGRLSSLPVTLAAGLGLGMLGPVVQHEIDIPQGMPETAAFVIVLLSLLGRRRTGRADVGGAGLPPVPLAPMPSGRRGAIAAGGVLVVGLVLPFLSGDVPSAGRLAAVVAWSVAVLSLVLLAGVVGQVSLCTGSFMGISAFVAAICLQHGMPFLLTFVVGAAVGGVVAALVALPAVRLAPLELAIATISLSFAADRFLLAYKPFVSDDGYRSFTPDKIFNGLPKPVGGGIDGARGLVWLSVIAFILVGLAVANLRRGRTGAALTALRSSGAATSAMGFSVTVTKLKGFAVSGVIAGIAGVLLSAGLGQVPQVGNTQGTPFDTTQSITLLAYAVIAGLGSVPGAIIGGILVELPTYLNAASSGVQNADLGYITNALSGVILIGVVVFLPQGLAGSFGRISPFRALKPAVA